MPFHIHIEEQPQEIEDCKISENGKTPLKILADLLEDNNEQEIHNNNQDCNGDSSSVVTAVHCTFSERIQVEY